MRDPIKVDWRYLAEVAAAASARSWSPYSNFPVGAAILMADGEIVSGCNVENASFGLTNCAERTAVFSAVARGYRRGDFVALAVYTPGDSSNSPCGACRQVLAEFFDPASEVRAFCEGTEEMRWTVGGLLPDGFAFL